MLQGQQGARQSDCQTGGLARALRTAERPNAAAAYWRTQPFDLAFRAVLEIHPLSIGIPADGERPELPSVCAATGVELTEPNRVTLLCRRARMPVWTLPAMAVILVATGFSISTWGWGLLLPGLAFGLAVPYVAGRGVSVEVPVTPAAGAAYRRATRLRVGLAFVGLAVLALAVAAGMAWSAWFLTVPVALLIILVGMYWVWRTTNEAPELRATQEGDMVMVEEIHPDFVVACRREVGQTGLRG